MTAGILTEPSEGSYTPSPSFCRCKTFWRGTAAIPYFKTENGARDIDLPENMPKLLVEFIGNRKSGLLFRTSNDKPVQHSSPPSPPRSCGSRFLEARTH